MSLCKKEGGKESPLCWISYITQAKLQEGFFVSCLHLFLHAHIITSETVLMLSSYRHSCLQMSMACNIYELLIIADHPQVKLTGNLNANLLFFLPYS